MTTFEQVKEMLTKQLNLSKDKVTEGSDIVKDLGADSLDIVELVMSLEDQFSIEVPEDMADKLKTVKDIVNFIENLK